MSKRNPKHVISRLRSIKNTGFAKRFTTTTNNLKQEFIRRPLVGVLIVFSLLVLIVVAASFTRRPKPVAELPEAQPLEVMTHVVNGQGSEITTSGVVKNLQAMTLVAQTAGPVSRVNLEEGARVWRGSTILSQETGYALGNAAAVGAQVAAKNLEIAEASLKNTAESVSKSRSAADLNRENTEELRKINQQSIDGTRRGIDLTKQIIAKLETDLAAATDAAIIQGLRQQLLTYQGLLVQNESALRSLEYTTNTDQEPNKLADVSKDQVYLAAQLQLDTAQLYRDIAALNLKSAQIQAGLSHVKAPFAGTVERIMVQPGQYVTPGTPVARIVGKSELNLIVSVSGAIASRVEETGRLKLTLDDQELQIPIAHVPSTPTNGQLFEILSVIPAEYAELVFEGQALEVTVPLMGAANTSLGSTLLPLDAVFISSNERFVYLEVDGKAQRRTVTTGSIWGEVIQIKTGLDTGDRVILDRRVIEGQEVSGTPAEKKELGSL